MDHVPWMILAGLAVLLLVWLGIQLGIQPPHIAIGVVCLLLVLVALVLT
jgi:hypothetical protein